MRGTGCRWRLPLAIYSWRREHDGVGVDQGQRLAHAVDAGHAQHESDEVACGADHVVTCCISAADSTRGQYETRRIQPNVVSPARLSPITFIFIIVLNPLVSAALDATGPALPQTCAVGPDCHVAACLTMLIAGTVFTDVKVAT